jgi:hypothetical protein
MLISPPFLPARANPQVDETWLATALSGGDQIGQGFFPVGPHNAWHGGLHLLAPTGDGSNLPVCAIADGTVAFRRDPKTASKAHALNYHGTDQELMWTDNGVVVLRHTLELGDGDLSAVVVYSVYMHLSRLHADLPAQGDPITRKTRLGTAGSVAGTSGTIHFEIIVAPEQIVRLCGRNQRRLNTATAGRTTVLGTVYARLPAGTEWKSDVAFPATVPVGGGSAGTAAAGIAYTSTEVLYAGLQYENAACVITLYKENGDVFGAPRTEAQGHYTLHDLSAARFPASPLAGYELMRYGRTIGTQALAPAGAAHWRQLPRPGGAGWVNLNADGVLWYSDADFPHWRGWHMVADDAGTDVRIDSAIVDEIRRGDAAAPTTPSLQAPAEGGNADKLSKLVCLFPTEWSDSDAVIEQRYGWVKALPIVSGAPQENYDKFAAYIKALGFWDAAGLTDIPATHWHLNPRALIGLLRGSQLWPALANVWQTACSGHVLPADGALSLGAKASLHEYALRSSKAAAREHAGAVSTLALQSIDAGNALIFGLRVETDINANNGRGQWDDRVLVLKRDKSGLIEVKHRGRINTEPSGWYLDGGQYKQSNNGSVYNVGGSTHKDSGRLAGDRSYEYQPSNSADFGSNIGGTTFNILRKTASSPVERLTTVASTLPANTYVSGANTHWVTGTATGFYEGATMHFHRGYNTMTGSAGCQTFPTTSLETFYDFADSLKPMDANNRYQYVLRKL